MEKVILIRYGELYLKGRNKAYFERLLNANILRAIKKYGCRLETSRNRTFIVGFKDDDINNIINRTSKIFGIHSLSLAVKVQTDLEIISQIAAELAPDNGSFRVTVKRADKTIPLTSQELSAEFGAYILNKKPNLNVDLHNPDCTVSIDIRENKITYVFYDTIMGAEGMPVGTAGRGLLLLSGGIDSPVAGYMMSKRGMALNAIHFHSYPYTSEYAKQKVIDLANILTEYSGNINLYIIRFTEIQQAIHEHCREDFMITVMRRIMVKISEKIASFCKCGALITGESLGQVASQTLESITSTNNAAENIPILRPLIGMDKSEIIKISRKMNAYDTSIQPYEDCCTIFLPKNPIIHPDLKTAIAEEAKIPNLSQLINDAVSSVEKQIISCKSDL